STVWIIGHFAAHLTRTPWRPGPSLLVWALAGGLYTAGVWAQLVAAQEATPLAWIVPAILAGCVAIFLLLDVLRRRDLGNSPRSARGRSGAALLTALLVIAGVALSQVEAFDADSRWVRLLGPWQQDAVLLRVALLLWLGSTVLLFLGLATPLAAFATWA